MKENIELDLSTIQQVEIDILKKIDKICKENNLSYSLSEGTAIGAVRHRGFIPWDDDIDIIMLRKDYDKLKEIMTTNEYTDIKYISCETQEDCWNLFAKVVDLRTEAKEIGVRPTKDYGVFVDIFPIDNLPNDERERKRYIYKLNILRKIHSIKLYKKQISKSKKNLIIKNIIALFLKPINLRKLVIKINKLMQKYKNVENCKYVGSICTGITLKKKKIYEKDFFDSKIYINFEDAKFMIISNYDKYLKDVYGNYMKLPPKEKQVSDHNWEFVRWKK